MRHGRLLWPTPEELPEEARELYARIARGKRAEGAQAFALTDAAGRLEGPFNALLLAPELGNAVQELGVRLRYAGRLSARAREIAILELATSRECEFEWYAHQRLGLQNGLRADEVAAIRNGADAATFDRQESLVRQVVRELALTRQLTAERYDAAAASLGAPLILELVTLVGYYDLLALSLRVFETPLPAGVAKAFGES